MIGVNKPFSNSLFLANDPPSRKVVIEYFTKHGMKVDHDPDKFAIDLITKDGSLKIEVERRGLRSWATGEWKWPTVHVPQRKGIRFLSTEGHWCYVILSHDMAYIGMTPDSKLKKYLTRKYLIEVPNIHVTRDEYFYDVPKEAFKFDKV